MQFCVHCSMIKYEWNSSSIIVSLHLCQRIFNFEWCSNKSMKFIGIFLFSEVCLATLPNNLILVIIRGGRSFLRRSFSRRSFPRPVFPRQVFSPPVFPLLGLFPLGLFPTGLFRARSFTRQVFSPPVFSALGLFPADISSTFFIK